MSSADLPGLDGDVQVQPEVACRFRKMERAVGISSG